MFPPFLDLGPYGRPQQTVSAVQRGPAVLILCDRVEKTCRRSGELQHDAFGIAFVDEQSSLVAENERLLEEARDERVRHEALLRYADRRIRAGLDVIRRSTLRAVPK